MSEKITQILTPHKALTPEAWAAWKSHPITQIFMQYVQDTKISIAGMIADAVANGYVPEHAAIERDAMQCEVLNLVLEITPEIIINFYEDSTEEEKEEQHDDY